MRGTILGNVLLLLTIALTLVLTSASVGIFNLRFTNALDNRDHARNLAEAAIYQAIALINANPAYGKSNETPAAVTISGLAQEHRGVLTFSPTEAGNLKCKRSTNNLDSNAAQPGDGQAVPEDGVHLVGLGLCGDARCQLEMVYYRPPFTKAIAASGNVSLSTVTLTGLQPGQAFDPATYQNMLGDTTLFSNNGGADALNITGECDIRGSVGAVGRVALDSTVRVAGEVRPGQPPEEVPGINVASIVSDIAGLPNLVAPTSPLSSFAHMSTGGTLSSLRLDGGVLAVTGDLTIDGPVSGYGAIIVNGNIRINGGAGVGSDFAAIAASGDIWLEASSAATNFFQGLLYSRGNITARRITVIGSIVADGLTADTGKVDLEDMRFVSTSAPLQGGIAPPQLFDLGGGDDSVVIQLASRVRPGTLDIFDYFGTGFYSISGGVSEIGEVLEDTEYTATFQGDRDTVIAQLRAFLDSDDSDYYGEIGGTLEGILTALSGVGGGNVVSFDLNKLLTAQEQSRLLLFREVTD